MNILLRFSITVLLVFLSGCAAKVAPKIYQGGFLNPDDYTALQNAADHLPPHPTGYDWGDLAGKPWSPTWIYYASNINFEKFYTITIPDLSQQSSGTNDFIKEIPDAIKKELIDKKLFHNVYRENFRGGLALIGSLSREKEGSVARSVVAMADSNIIQVEFKIMENDKQIGAIQTYAMNVVPMGLSAAIARAIEGSLADQIAERVSLCFEGLRSGKYSGSAEGKHMETDWIVPAAISK